GGGGAAARARTGVRGGRSRSVTAPTGCGPRARRARRASSRGRGAGAAAADRTWQGLDRWYQPIFAILSSRKRVTRVRSEKNKDFYRPWSLATASEPGTLEARPARRAADD